MTFATRTLMIALSITLWSLAPAWAASAKPKEIADPAQAQADPDFAVQGEYLGKIVGADGVARSWGSQVIARGEGK